MLVTWFDRSKTVLSRKGFLTSFSLTPRGLYEKTIEQYSSVFRRSQNKFCP